MTALRYGVVFDRHDRDGIRALERQLHDKLISELGHSRRGPVSWYRYSALDMDECRRIITIDGDFRSSETDELLAVLEAHPQGVLVVARLDWEVLKA